MVEHGDIRHFGDGDVIVREGERGREMFMVVSGSVRISKEKEGVETVLAHLSEGEIFGEMALVEEGRTRSASATAHGPVALLVMDKDSFLAQVRRDPSLAFDVLRSLCSRLRQVDDVLQEFTVKDHKRQENVRNFMRARGYL